MLRILIVLNNITLKQKVSRTHNISRSVLHLIVTHVKTRMYTCDVFIDDYNNLDRLIKKFMIVANLMQLGDFQRVMGFHGEGTPVLKISQINSMDQQGWWEGII